MYCYFWVHGHPSARRMRLRQIILSPVPSPNLALWAHVTPPWYPSSRQTTLASLMSTSSSQTVPQVLLCSTSTRPSYGSCAKLPAKRTFAAGARAVLRREDTARGGSARAGHVRDSSTRTGRQRPKQRMRVIVEQGSSAEKDMTFFFLFELIII